MSNLTESFTKSINSSGEINLDSLRENLSSTLNNMEPVTTSLNSSSSPSTFNSFWSFFKITFIVVILFMLGINLFTFIKYKKDALTYYFGDIFDVNKREVIPEDEESDEEDLEKTPLSKNDSEEGTVYTAVDLAAEKDSKLEKETSDELNDIINEGKATNVENDIENKLNIKNEQVLEESKQNYKANNLSTNVNKKAGFCYLGTDRGVRTCAEVTDEDTCLSNQVFPTKDLCINPNLKE